MKSYAKKEYIADVLVVGGGIAAVFAATKASKAGAKVVVVDKGSIGRSGQTPFASAMAIFDEELGHKRDEWHRIIKENSKNLNNSCTSPLHILIISVSRCLPASNTNS